MKMQITETLIFRQCWLWLEHGGIGLLFTLAWIQQLIPGIPFGDNSMSKTELIIDSFVLYAVIFFSRMKLTSRINAGEFGGKRLIYTKI